MEILKQILKQIEKSYKLFVMPYDFSIFIGLALMAWIAYGFIVALLILLCWCLLRILLMRDILMMGIRSTETNIYGKPLDKDMWKKGEPVKTRWNK
jgi:hypothetical protein